MSEAINWERLREGMAHFGGSERSNLMCSEGEIALLIVEAKRLWRVAAELRMAANGAEARAREAENRYENAKIAVDNAVHNEIRHAR
jgi:hypothetical protein